MRTPCIVLYCAIKMFFFVNKFRNNVFFKYILNICKFFFTELFYSSRGETK